MYIVAFQLMARKWWHALVSPKLDYPTLVLSETFLQHVQNTVVRVVTFDGDLKIWTQLAKLHWLPVAVRINFKIAALTFKALTTCRTSYQRVTSVSVQEINPTTYLL